ncbi:hypothetical protein KXS11_05890 [Plantibacter flavus]|uniref:sugar-binding transcriptional regulator n=1 Tax=Plantibacter flavus TaxID=150123 RepID=UPI003F16C1DD
MTDLEQRRARPQVSLEAALVARRYYIDDRQKSEIAEELGLSRFKVARLLDEAKASGIVRISIDMPAEIDVPLGEELAAAFSLSRAIVVRTFGDDASRGPVLGAAAADYLATAIGPEDVLGISWGSTLTYTVDAVSSIAAAAVVQLVGGVRAGRLQASGVDLVRRLSEKTGGGAYPLHAPLLVRTPEMAQQLRTDPSLAEAIGRFPTLTKALVGIGSWQPPKSSLFEEFDADERETLLADGAAADICTLVFDENGTALDSTPLSRSVGITLDELRRLPEVIAVAGGPAKANAIAAALRSGTVDTIVTDIETVEHILGR